MTILEKIKQWLGVGIVRERDDAIRKLSRTADELDRMINDDPVIPPEERLRKLVEAARGQRPHG